MFSRIRGFISRHRRKFIVTSIIVGGSIIIFQYAQRKLREFQEREAKEFIERTRRLQHFESTERTCNQVIMGMSKELSKEIIKEIDTEEVLTKLRNNPDNKVELWEEMKILSFTRLTTFIYATSMLIITLRIQLNVLGGYLYKDTISNEQKITDEIKQTYLSLIHYFINGGGLQELIRLIRTKVRETLKTKPLAKQYDLDDLEHMFYSIQMVINGDIMDPNSKMAKYVIPQRLPLYSTGPLFERMFNETKNILESEEIATICSNNISRGFSLAVDAISEKIGQIAKSAEKTIVNGEVAATSSKEQTINDVTSAAVYVPVATTTKELFNICSVKLAMAKLIPIVNSLSSKSFDSASRPQNLATSLTTSALISEKIKSLGAKIYEEFSS